MRTGRPKLQPPASLAEHTARFVRPIVLARYTGVAISTLYDHIDKGALRVVRRGRTIQIPIESAREYAADLPTQTSA